MEWGNEAYYARFEKNLEPFKKTTNKILELGAYRGDSSKFFSDKFLDKKTSELHCVDTWKGSVEYDEDFKDNEKEFKKKIKASKNYEKITVHKKTTSKFFLDHFNEKKKPYFNLIYIDACHDGRCVMSDALNSFKSLKLNGYIVFDDYGWKKTKHDYERPKLAIDSFIQLFRDNIKIISKGYKMYIQKTKEYEF